MRHNIYEKGYGYIPRLIMEDRRLSALSKSIYAYFCSFSEGKASLFPSQDKNYCRLKYDRGSISYSLSASRKMWLYIIATRF